MVKITEPKPGHLEIRCEYCGEYITTTSTEFGMDCVNGCSQKAYQKVSKKLKALAFTPASRRRTSP